MLINYRRNLLIAQEMIDAGIPAVPNLYSFRLEDLRRYETWLERHRPAGVACNLQTQRTDDVFYELLLPGLTYLAQILPPETKFIATGSSRTSRIAELLGLFGDRLHLVSQNPIQYARHGAGELFDELGADLGIEELQELSSNVALAGGQGAKVKQSLIAKADAMRAAQAAQLEAAAEVQTEKMIIPVVVLIIGMVLFIGYGAVDAISSPGTQFEDAPAVQVGEFGQQEGRTH